MSDPSSTPNLVLTPEAIEHLGTTRKWTMFLSISGFVYIGLVILLGLVSLALTMVGKNESTLGLGESFLALLIYMIVGAVYVIPLYALFKFSSSVKRGLAHSDMSEMTAAFRYLKNHYASLGVLFIFVLVIIVLGIFIAIILALQSPIGS